MVVLASCIAAVTVALVTLMELLSRSRFGVPVTCPVPLTLMPASDDTPDGPGLAGAAVRILGTLVPVVAAVAGVGRSSRRLTTTSPGVGAHDNQGGGDSDSN